MYAGIQAGRSVVLGLVVAALAGCGSNAGNNSSGTTGGNTPGVGVGTNPGGTGTTAGTNTGTNASGGSPAGSNGGVTGTGAGAGSNPSVSGGAGASGGGSSPGATGTGGTGGAVMGTMMGGAGAGSTGGTGGSGGTATAGDKPPCTTKASQVVILGDSYLNWASHTFGADMAKAAGETWRMMAVGGYSMGSGGIGLIPPEFDQAVAADPDIKAAVMDGGGNDILIPAATWVGGGNCKNEANAGTDPVCQMIIQTAFDAATKLMNHMADSGVRDVVYIFYPHVPNGTVLGGSNPNASLDYALPMAKDLCVGAEARTSGKLRCHFLDLVPVFDGHMDWFAAGDIHENSTGSAAMAKAVWQIMTDKCIAQKASSGCCTP